MSTARYLMPQVYYIHTTLICLSYSSKHLREETSEDFVFFPSTVNVSSTNFLNAMTAMRVFNATAKVFPLANTHKTIQP